MLATARRNLRFGLGLLGLMPWSGWPKLGLYFALSGLGRATGWRPLRRITLRFRDLAIACEVGRPAGLKFLLEIAGYRVYEPLATEGAAVLFDVGANAGYFAILRCLENPALRAYCFEPHPKTFVALRRNIALNGLDDRITAVQAAVGDQEGALELGLPIGSSMGVVQGPGAIDTTGGRVPVRGITLDSFVRANVRPDLLKIDVEGHEAHVLRGATRVLEAVGALIMEVHTADLHRECLGLLEAAGFEVQAHGNLLLATRR